MYKKQKTGRKFVSLSSSSSRIAILFILLIFSLSLSIITILYISQHQQAMAQTNTTTPSQDTNITATDAFSTYENTTYGIKIQAPAAWRLGESNQTSEDNAFNYIVAFAAPADRASDRLTENVIVAVENLPPEENISLDAYSTVQLFDLTQFATDFDLKESTPTILAGIPAYKVVFSETVGQLPLMRMQVWTIKDNKAYVIAFAGEAAKYSTYLPTVQKIFDSFELINSTTGSNNSTAQS